MLAPSLPLVLSIRTATSRVEDNETAARCTLHAEPLEIEVEIERVRRYVVDIAIANVEEQPPSLRESLGQNGVLLKQPI